MGTANSGCLGASGEASGAPAGHGGYPVQRDTDQYLCHGATMTETEHKTISLRLPLDVWDALVALADLQDRSLNAQIVRILRREIEGGQEQEQEER